MKKRIYDFTTRGPFTLAQYTVEDEIQAYARLLYKKSITKEEVLLNTRFIIPPVKVIPGKLSAAIKEAGLNKITRSREDVWDSKIMLEIDLTYGRDQILKKVEEAVRFYEVFTGKQPRKKKKTELDPWEVFDLHTINEMTLREIARKFKKESSKHVYSIDVWQKRVENAYRRAFELLKSFGITKGIRVNMVNDKILIWGEEDEEKYQATVVKTEKKSN